MQMHTNAKQVAASVFVAAAAFSFFVGCSRTVEDGELGPFAVGMTRSQIFQILQDSNVRLVEPIPKNRARIRDPESRGLSDLVAGRGVAIRDDHRHVYVALADDSVVNVTGNSSYASRHGIHTNMSKDELLAALRALLNDESNAEIAAYIPTGRYVDLTSLTDTDRADMWDWDVWRFNDSSERLAFGTSYEVEFSKDRVNRITKRWMLGELP